jgi:hypothetical protein
MSNELRLLLDPVQTGLTLNARYYTNNAIGSANIPLVEQATTALYLGDLDYTALADGTYSLQTIDSADNSMVGSDEFIIVGGNRVDEDYLRKTINNSALQEH